MLAQNRLSILRQSSAMVKLPFSRADVSLSTVVCWTLVFFVGLTSAIGLARLGPLMAPVRRGSPTTFWVFATGVDLDNTRRLDYIPGGTAYVVDDEWLAYEDGNLHGTDIYAVRREDALVHFPAVVAELERQQQEGKDSVFVDGFAAWKTDNPASNDIDKLIASVTSKMHERRYAREIGALAYAVAQEQNFWQRWRRQKWYWANFVFEWLFLTGLALFAVWPGIRRRGHIAWILHLAPLPFLFLLPVWLGYAAWTFTSVGPSGGIVYPYLVVFVRPISMFNDFDRWLLERTPQILEPLSVPTGPYVSMTGMGMPGPTWAVVAGIALGAVTYVVGTLGPIVTQKLRRRRDQSPTPNR